MTIKFVRRMEMYGDVLFPDIDALFHPMYIFKAKYNVRLICTVHSVFSNLYRIQKCLACEIETYTHKIKRVGV